MPVVLVGTLDTKGEEVRFVRDLLTAAGIDTIVVDAGVLGTPAFTADVTRENVYHAAGVEIADLRRLADRGKAIEAAGRGVAAVVTRLQGEGKVQGILGMGGSAGTTIGTAAMRALPFGVPKLMVSTLASGQVKQWIGVKDILMMPSVVDISGLNRISSVVLTNAASAMIGMVQAKRQPPVRSDRPLITATMFGVTTPCVEACRRTVEEAGYETLVFHATGIGGMTMESFIKDGMVEGVLDITTTELADELVGGILTAGPDRLTASGLLGVPQVISLGALDMVNFGPPDTVPAGFKDRRFYPHNPSVTLMRTTPEENDWLGKEIAEKASAARGPTAILVPLRGVSAIDREGQPFWWPEADQALFKSLRLWLAPQVKLIELDLHINDPAFAQALAGTLLQMLAKRRPRSAAANLD